MYIAFYLILCAFVIRWAERPLDRKLENAIGVKNALEVRRQLFARRKVLTIISIVLYICLLVANSFSLFSFVMGLLYFFLFHPYSNLRGNISIYEKDSFLREHDSFVFYLRGFYTDQYINAYRGYLLSIPIFSLVSKLVYKKHRLFDENVFMRRLTLRNLPCPCAIGNPKEKDSPGGAIRVYLGDNTWYDDVVEMMDRSSMVVILINNSPSCMLEIKHSQALLGKTVFLIPNPILYEDARSQVAASFSLPPIPSDIEPPCYFYIREGTPIFRHFYNDESGCIDLGDEISELYHAKVFSNNHDGC